MYTAKRVVLITSDVKFSINAKEALERDHAFTVTAFANASGAVDYVRHYPQDAVVIDFRVGDMPGKDVLDHLRTINPHIAIIAAPDVDIVRKMKKRYDIQAVVDLPVPTRRFVMLLTDAIQAAQGHEQAPPAPRNKPKTAWETPQLEPTTIEFWVSDLEDGTTVFQMPAEEVPASDESTELFNKLASEEPPLPDFSEGSTVRDLHQRLLTPHSMRRIVDVLEDTSPSEDIDELDEESQTIPAALIIETALDESTPIDEFSAEEFMQRVRERQTRDGIAILPLPSWLEESQRFIREPDFLPEDLPGFSQPLEYTSTVTEANQTLPQDPGNMKTDPIEPVQRSHPRSAHDDSEGQADANDTASVSASPMPPLPPELNRIPKPISDADVPASAPETETEASEPPLPPEMDIRPQSTPEVLEKPDPQPIASMPYTHHEHDDPEIAQLALTLTQVSLELTAEATLLARDGRLVAYSGALPREEIEDLLVQLAGDWSADENRARIRFVTLPSSGKDYMIYSRRTDSGYTLSMFFVGTMPLHVIRRQGKRLADALVITPEDIELTQDSVPVPTMPEYDFPIPDADVTTFMSFTYVWMLRHAERTLNQEETQTLVVHLETLLEQAKWDVQTLSVRDDYIYLHANMPADLDPHTIITDLMRVSAVMVQAVTPAVDPHHLWDDSYLVLHPGRDMEQMEIQQFIQFVHD